jgi:hypothetical protein
MATLAGRGYSFSNGGPFYELTQRLHLLGPNGTLRFAWLVAVAWVPLVLVAVVRLVFGMPVSPLVLDISVHVRFLVALPLLLVSSHLLDAACRGAVRALYDAQLAEPAALDPIMLRAEQLRTSGWVELVIALLALAIGQLGLWGVTAPTGLFHGVEHHTLWSFSRIWYSVISFPLWQFLSARWMWRWGVWIYTLVRLSRLPLAATASHPDHAGGLGCLAWPLTGYSWYVAAFASVLAGAWDTQLLEQRLTISSLAPSVVTLVIAAVLVGYVPLLVFTPQLYAVKRRDLMKHTLFGFDYMRQFERTWMGDTRADVLAGTDDIQGMAAYVSAFLVVQSTRLTVFDPKRMKNLAIAVLLPMVPMLASLIPLSSVMPRLTGVLVPGL